MEYRTFDMGRKSIESDFESLCWERRNLKVFSFGKFIGGNSVNIFAGGAWGGLIIQNFSPGPSLWDSMYESRMLKDKRLDISFMTQKFVCMSRKPLLYSCIVYD